jgi:hypothetical protein
MQQALDHKRFTANYELGEIVIFDKDNFEQGDYSCRLLFNCA